MISKQELLKGRDLQFPHDYTDVVSANLDALLIPLNKIREAYGQPMLVDSGWRPPSINAATPGAATHSKHMSGLACDIADPNGQVLAWVLQNLDLMKQLNIYMEDFRWTPTWVHFQLGGPASGKRIFVPSANRPLSPARWDGHYDTSLDG